MSMAPIYQSIEILSKEKGIDPRVILEAIKDAMLVAARKHFHTDEVLEAELDDATGQIHIYGVKTIVDQVADPKTEVSLAEAQKYSADAEVGQQVRFPKPTDVLGRISAQTAKQVVVQRIREAERRKIFDDYNDRIGEVVTGTVQRREGRNILVALGKLDAVLPPQEQVESEPYRHNDRLKVYVLEVKETNKGPQVVVSRTHPSLIRRLFELEVPEISDGVVTIKSVAREPGARSKIAVTSRDEKVDPVGACVGHRGSRVQAVVNELYDEKIDIVRWNEDVSLFISEALSPAKAVKVAVDDDGKSALVTVPDNQLSLAIGKQIGRASCRERV